MHREEPRYMEFPRVPDKRGHLIFIEGENTIPFPIKRVYYICNIPDKSIKRGGHAHKGVKEVVVALAGSFTAICDNGSTKSIFPMSQFDIGLYVPEMVWLELSDFSSGAICLVLSSEYYNEKNYVRKYADFLKHISKGESK